MEDDRRVIAKTSHPNVGPLVLTTASEVATMEFARTVLDLPVPQVLAWSATDQNPVQAEYIIMEGARGSQLHEVWEDLSIWASCVEYLQSIVRREIDWISNYAHLQEPKETPWQYKSPEQNSPESHIALLQKFLAAIPLVTPQDPELTSPRLWHPDFHAGNIYIVEGSPTAEKDPLMNKVMRHPHGKTLKQVEAFVGATWDNCLFPFEECLISIEREWELFYAN
ncbi:hypothetical protein GRF29_8g3379801 [Pseudopithomyces chartarum]|uniref:Altered inheritance of mitochondria protein 9, mitochondrial n=1 Tax=Pseudopithomyces chartarum TaxID=1892770 RepID=A0AAN6RLS1_9PLEO|nr:hypothetical protein GRF29_8g3379801 [Pseudopithomyces chartarum]